MTMALKRLPTYYKMESNAEGMQDIRIRGVSGILSETEQYNERR
jgi:hypothetical protein